VTAGPGPQAASGIGAPGHRALSGLTEAGYHCHHDDVRVGLGLKSSSDHHPGPGLPGPGDDDASHGDTDTAGRAGPVIAESEQGHGS
jgi:hypothetical protein